MKFLSGAALAAAALALAACQGGFGSGGTSAPGGITPPVSNNQTVGSPQLTPSPSSSPSAPPGDTVTYPFAKAADGLPCPDVDGYSCVLHFNMPPATPTPNPKDAKAKAKATPSPTPSPTATPCTAGSVESVDAQGNVTSAPSSSPCPSPVPSAKPTGTQVTLQLAGLPKKNVPPMVNPDPKAVSTAALVALRVSTDSDATLDGRAMADFTIPKEQIGGRGFALQLFHDSVGKHNKHDYQFIGSFSKSTLDGSTLRFELSMPKIAVKKNETWLFVLYGDELPESSGPPTASASPSSAPSGSASASPAPSPAKSPLP